MPSEPSIDRLLRMTPDALRLYLRQRNARNGTEATTLVSAPAAAPAAASAAAPASTPAAAPAGTTTTAEEPPPLISAEWRWLISLALADTCHADAMSDTWKPADTCHADAAGDTWTWDDVWVDTWTVKFETARHRRPLPITTTTIPARPHALEQ